MSHTHKRPVGIPRLLALAALLFACAPLMAQQSQYDRGTPPQHAAGVSQIGSYLSTDLGTVNLSNGSLNFKLPLGAVGGRGLYLPLTLNYSSKVWSGRIDTEFTLPDPPPDVPVESDPPVAYAMYAEGDTNVLLINRIAPGWTIGFAPLLKVRGVPVQKIPNNSSTCGYAYGLVKLTLVLPDKGEVEFRDDLSDGAPLPAQPDSFGCLGRDGDRGRRWHATDGSGMVFISDVDRRVSRGELDGVLISSDGTRYRFDGASHSQDLTHLEATSAASSITDRNGNRIIIGQNYVDPLGRVTRLQQNVPDPHNPSVTLPFLVTVPGYGGASRYVKIKTGVMNQNYAEGVNPALPVINGDWDPKSLGYDWEGTSLFPKSYGLYAQRIDDLMVVTEVVLPDGRSLRFKYNEFGEVAEVLYPTGGRVRYTYGRSNSLPSGNSPLWETTTQSREISSEVRGVDRAVKTRSVFADGVNPESTWSYGYGPLTHNGVTYNGAEVLATSPSGEVLLHRRHFFLPNGRYTESPAGESGSHDGSHYTLWSTGVEWRTETLDTGTLGTSGPVIAADEQDWSQRAPVAWGGYPQEQPANDNRVNETRKILDDGKVARTATLYDQYSNPARVSEYDFDGALKRCTVTEYLSANDVNGIDYTGDAYRMLRLPVRQSVYDSSCTDPAKEAARTIYQYDKYSPDGNNEPLLTYPSVSGHDSANFGAGRAARGNVTRAGRWLKEQNTYFYTYSRYDLLGNVVSVKDPRGNVSAISFADDFGDGADPNGANPDADAIANYVPTYAFPTLLTSPPPNPGEEPHTARSQYDYSAGLLTGFKDRNGVVTQTVYDDPFNRPTLVRSALGVEGVESQAAMFYAPATVFGVTLAGNDVMTVKDLSTLGDGALRSWTRTDGLGRTVEAVSSDPQGDVSVKTVYDALGRARFVTNPYRAQAASTDGWTRTSYDRAGRVKEVATFSGGAGAPPPEEGTDVRWTGSVRTSYAGTEATVTDQSQKKRKSVSDALGRMIKVYEDPEGENYLTSYDYDVLDKLRTVTQGPQTRHFIFDSLGRLTSASNPEACEQGQGQCVPVPTVYEYDPNGNLKKKTDAEGRVTSFVYDALGRVTARSYTDGTPAVNFFYDTQFPAGAAPLDPGLSIGRLVAVTYGGGPQGSYSGGYDANGRVRLSRQVTDTGMSEGVKSYGMAYDYDLAGNLRHETYPSGRVVTTEYNSAGRITGVKNQATGAFYVGTAANDVNDAIRYAPHGAVTAMKLGNNLWEHTNFNSRLQPTQIGLGASAAGAGVLKLDYTYGMATGGTPDPTKNNGNLQSQTITLANLSLKQTYDYDQLNRLIRAEEKKAAATTWKQIYSYDRFGNRTLTADSSYPMVLDGANNPAINPANNRITSVGYAYDAAGNLACDPLHPCGQSPQGLIPYFTYDAENRLTTAGGGPAVGGTAYHYDGEGRRVKKVSGTVTTVFVYDVAGRLVAEYSNQTSGAGTSYMTQDHLGSVRVVTDPAGNTTSRHDYLPFGEEISSAMATDSGRETIQSYNYGTVRQKFTAKELDVETGLYFFGARYYISPLGRFSSCDPIGSSSQHIADPQRWNMFVYVENNPLALIDPDGMDGQGQDGKRIITVYLNYAKEELDAGHYDGQGKFVKQATLNKPDWNTLKESAGKYGFELIIRDRAVGVHYATTNSASDFEKQAAQSELMVIAGHAGINSETGAVSEISLSNNSAITAPGSNTFHFGGTNKGEVSFGGKAIAYFGCNTDALAVDGMIAPSDPNAQYIGVKDGDGAHSSSVPTNNLAAYKYVEAYMQSGGDQKMAQAAAQKAYKDSNFSGPAKVNGRTKHVYYDRFDEVTSRTIK